MPLKIIRFINSIRFFNLSIYSKGFQKEQVIKNNNYLKCFVKDHHNEFSYSKLNY